MTSARLPPAALAVFGELALPAKAATFRCQSNHPDIWGVLTIAADRARARVAIQGDRASGPKLEFVNGRTGPVQQGSSVNLFGSDVVRQIVVISEGRILVGWLDPDGELNYAATLIRTDRRHCRWQQLDVDLG